jgi:hypothetical protein
MPAKPRAAPDHATGAARGTWGLRGKASVKSDHTTFSGDVDLRFARTEATASQVGTECHA